jgi:hypothetical protein
MEFRRGAQAVRRCNRVRDKGISAIAHCLLLVDQKGRRGGRRGDGELVRETKEKEEGDGVCYMISLI